MKPVIGITPSYNEANEDYIISASYFDAVKKAGGYPVLLSLEESLPDFIDGIILSGGGDIDPMLFGEEPIYENGEICPLRDQFEIWLCKKALDKGMPIFGICRGMQLLSIISGGKIYQDIRAQTNTRIKHSQNAPKYHGTHTVDIVENSTLHSIIKDTQIVVNSFHHQSLSKIEKPFIVSARSRDGLIEAIEHEEGRFILGVQWHPEKMSEQVQKNLFNHFVRACL